MGTLPPAPYGADVISKFGENHDIDTATVPEDLWTAGGVYPFPAAAAATTIQSSDAADTAAGTGAQTVEIQGLDADYNLISETATLNGVTPVNLVNQYLRVFRAKVLTAGTGTTNAGNITIQHGATVLAQIDIGEGQTLMAIYTVPADYEIAYIQSIYVSFGRVLTAVSARAVLQVRDYGGAWRTLWSSHITNYGSSDVARRYSGKEIPINPRTDIRIRITSVTANDCDFTGQFDLVLYRKSDLERG